jgi:hypothetical protein
MEVTKTNKNIGLILAFVLILSAISGGTILTTHAFDNQGGRPCKAPFYSDLTDEQKEEIKTIVEELREAGARREKIKAAVDSKLTEWGIEVPESKGPRLPPWISNLTDEQKEEIKTIVEELKEAGANRKEIRETVKKKLEEWNIELSEKP